MPAEKPVSYAWALHHEVGYVTLRRLTPEALEGLEWAQRLAENARERSRGIGRDLLHYAAPLTVADIAREQGRPVAQIEEQIEDARWELFRGLSDSGIRYRLKHGLRAARLKRLCAERGCDRLLPPEATRRRRYCREHATSAAKVRRQRRKRARLP
jgi:hypothetical protein